MRYYEAGRISVLFAALLIITAMPLWSGPSDITYSVDPESKIYFEHISLVDIKEDGFDPVVIRDGSDLEETAVLNFPISPGDTIRTSEMRLCEIQFDTGTIIRLDKATELKLVTILAPSLSSRYMITNLELTGGRVYPLFNPGQPDYLSGA